MRQQHSTPISRLYELAKGTPGMKHRVAYLAACRQVLGTDDPTTIVLAVENGDPRMDEVEALALSIAAEGQQNAS